MTIKTSGPISLADLRNEFGGSGPISMYSHYRGNGLVPATTGAGAGSFRIKPDASPSQIPDTWANQPANWARWDIQLSQFYGTAKAVPGPSPVLLTNTGEHEDYAYWTSPVTGTIYVTLVAAGGASGGAGSLWGGSADSGGGGGGGSAGQIIHRHAVSVTKGTSYAYRVKPVTYFEQEETITQQDGESYQQMVTYANAPRTEMFGQVPATGNDGWAGSYYDGGQGGASPGGGGAGGRGGNSRINTQGLAGNPGGNSAWAAGGPGGVAGTGWSSQSQRGGHGYGYGGGLGGWPGVKGNDNPDTAGGGGGGGGGFIPPGYAADFRPPEHSDHRWGLPGCIYIEFESSYPA